MNVMLWVLLGSSNLHSFASNYMTGETDWELCVMHQDHIISYVNSSY